MKFTFPAIFLLASLLGAGTLHSQESLPLPYALYGKLPVPAPALASDADRRIAAWLVTAHQNESQLAQWALKNSRTPEIRLLAERVARDNAAISAALKRWAESPNERTSASLPWLTIPSELLEHSLESNVSQLQSLSTDEQEEAYVKLQEITSRRQLDACKALSVHVTPGFRNQLENVREMAWRHSRDAAQVLKNTSGEAQVIAQNK